MYPSGPSLVVVIRVETCCWGGEPPDLRGNAARRVRQSFSYRVAYARAASNAIQEPRLKDTRDAEGG